MADTYLQEGQIITVVESAITHPTHADGLVDRADPVLVGKLPGVALTSAVASTDGIPVDTGHVHQLSVKGEDAAGAGIAVAIGDRIYFDTDAELNKDGTNGTAFGYALAAITSGATAVIPVLVRSGA